LRISGYGYIEIMTAAIFVQIHLPGTFLDFEEVMFGNVAKTGRRSSVRESPQLPRLARRTVIG